MYIAKKTLVTRQCLGDGIVASTVRIPANLNVFFSSRRCATPTVLLRPAAPPGSHGFSDPRPVRPRGPANPGLKRRCHGCGEPQNPAECLGSAAATPTCDPARPPGRGRHGVTGCSWSGGLGRAAGLCGGPAARLGSVGRLWQRPRKPRRWPACHGVTDAFMVWWTRTVTRRPNSGRGRRSVSPSLPVGRLPVAVAAAGPAAAAAAAALDLDSKPTKSVPFRVRSCFCGAAGCESRLSARMLTPVSRTDCRSVRVRLGVSPPPGPTCLSRQRRPEGRRVAAESPWFTP